MRIVVTGASGNLGTALLRRLRADGRHEVTGISRRRPPEVEPYAGTTWLEIDLARDGAGSQVERALRDADAVVHLAWLIQPSHDRELLRRVNQHGTRAVVEAAVRAGVPHLVHLSSVGTYAAAPGRWKDETWSTDGVPTSSYSVDKAACERLLDEADDRLAVTRVRPGLVLQPDAASEIARYFLGPLVPLTLLRPPVLRLAPLPASLVVQFVHADDVADALVRILETTFPGPVNLAADPVVDRAAYRRIVGGVGPPLPTPVLRAGAQLSWRLHLQPVDGGWVDLGQSAPLMRTTRARTDLGWDPKHRADATVAEFLSALRRGQGTAGPLLYARRRLGAGSR